MLPLLPTCDSSTFDKNVKGSRLTQMESTLVETIGMTSKESESSNKAVSQKKHRKTSQRTKPVANNPAHAEFRRNPHRNQSLLKIATDPVRFKK
ncbi:hypothetical protein MFLAVUS_011479 [Mucor flavus]|uniref:Uncharacterized protein n=1 Tax=Mucor flavus TaxID=439312 RepID=A0ABP9ZFJ9_9FUNG